MRTTVPSPSTRQPRYGLLASLGGEAAIRKFMAANAPEGGADRWMEGFSFQPMECSSDTDPFDPTCGTQSDFDEASSVPDAIQVDPFGIWDSVKCSTMTQASAELQARAQAKLDTSQSHKIEHEFWTGEWAQANTKASDYLARTGHVTEINGGAARPLVYALMDLQRELGDVLQGSRGMIHARSDTTTAWLSAGAVRREGNLILDAFDNIIVAGSGYDGSDPSGAVDSTNETAWAYGTSVVNVMLSDVTSVDWVEPADNVERYIAWRVAAVAFDDCAHLGVNVDMCTPCCTPS